MLAAIERKRMKSRRRCRLSGDLTRIRLQLAIYFCVHRGSLNQNAARWQASLRSIKPRPNYDRGLVLSTTGSILTYYRLGSDFVEGHFALDRRQLI